MIRGERYHVDGRAAGRRRAHDRAPRRRDRVRVRRHSRRGRRGRGREGAARHGLGQRPSRSSSRRPIASTGAPDGACGGSVLAHIAYERQRQLKRQIIDDAFRRIGRITLERRPRWSRRRPTGIACARGCTCATAASDSSAKARTRCAMPPRRASCGTTRSTCCGRLEASLATAARETVGGIEISENIDASERAIHLELLPERGSRRAWPRSTQVDGVTGATCAHGDNPRTIDLFGSPYVVGHDRRRALVRHVRSFFQGNRFLTGAAGRARAGLHRGRRRCSTCTPASGCSASRRRPPARGHVTAVEGDRVVGAPISSATPQGQEVSVRADAVESFLRADAATVRTVIVDPPRTGMSKEALAGVDRDCRRRASSTCRATSRRWRATRACCSMPATGWRRCARSICSRTPRTSKPSLRFRASLGSRRLFLPVVRRLDEAFEQRAELAGAPEILRDATAPRGRTASPGCSIASMTPSGAVAVTSKPGATPLHRLVVAAVDLAGLAVFHVLGEQRRQLRALRHPHFVRDARSAAPAPRGRARR